MSSDKNIVICGGGIIGTSIAYYLSQLCKTANITVIERESVACHSSGKAGGFLAVDWNDHNAVGPLSRLSFKLHEELASVFKDENLGYRKLSTFSIEAKASSKNKANGSSEWIDGNIIRQQSMGTESTTAQVHPYVLTHSFLKFSGATLKKATVTGLEFSKDQTVTKVVLDNKDRLDADIIVIAMGPWSSSASDFFPKCPKSVFNVKGSRAHSIVLEADVPAEALFTHYIDENGRSKEPEIYPRPDGTVYVCGEGDGVGLPAHPGEVTCRPGAGQKLQSVAGAICSTLKNAPVQREQACYLPCSPDGMPILGHVPHYQGAYIATGHGCWGILNAPATGKCMAQLILGQVPDIDLQPFSAERLLRQ